MARMENMKLKPVFIGFAAITIPLAAMTMMKFYTKTDRVHDAQWLYENMPMEMDQSSVRSSDEAPNISYKMDEKTYETLDPIGIGAQVWTTPKGQFDAVVIASDSIQAFHDQRICFNAQGWIIKSLKVRNVDVPTHGMVPFTVMELERDGGGTKYGIYTFRPPIGFTSYERAKIGFLIHELKTGQPGMGFSYRFIGMSNGLSEDDVIDFAKEFMANAKESSKGIL